jgi:hypothetical protein
MQPLERITDRVNRHGNINDHATPRPLLTLDEFFDGNDVIGSIGCNLVPTPSPSDFYEQLKTIASRSDVFDIRVQVTLFDAPEWPFSDTVWVVTTAECEDVLAWFDSSMKPDECNAATPDANVIESLIVPTGWKTLTCWWN